MYQRVLRDQRDRPFVNVTLQTMFILLPSALLLFVPEQPYWWQPILHLAIMLSLLDRWILMNHNVIHTFPFKKGWRWIGNLHNVLAPLYGMTPYTYFAHHVGMHHLENNGPDDLSSTQDYTRDSVFDFVRYFTRFVLMTPIDLGLYMYRRKRMKIMRRMLTSEFGCYALYAGLALWRPWAALFAFILPLAITRFLMMAGNWGQHAFVDADDPSNSYKNSITCVNCRYNRRAFNDGYHIGHHLYPRLHWQEMPVEYEKNLADYQANGAIVFEKIDFFIVWALLMTKQYNFLAKRMVSHQDLSHEERVALLHQRTRRIPVEAPAAEAAPTS